jgi:prophage antirepressor-like protein
VTEIIPFTFPTTGQTVRTVVIDGEPWFVGSDVAVILGYRDAFNAVRILDEDEKGTHLVSTPGGEQLASVVSEPGLYALIMRSNAIGAREFQRWVTHDVLPAIRRTGSYSLPAQAPDELELAQHNVRLILEKRAAEERAHRAEFQVIELAPAARAWDEMADASGDYAVREAAQILCRDPRISSGQKRLFAYLRHIGWIDRHNVPYQHHIQCGRVAIRASTYEHPKRDEDIATQQVRITVKGLGELHALLGGTASLPALMSEGVAA